MSEASASFSEHAERMDRMYRYQRHIYDLTRKYYLLGRDKAISDLRIPQGASLLEVGCGTGRNLLLAHRLYPNAKLFGLDISAQMLTSTRKTFAAHGQTPELRVADAASFTPAEFGVEGFDRIMISYALSMIPDWTSAVDASLSALKPGGSLHIIDFGQQERLPRWFRVALQAWLRRFHVTPRKELAQVLEDKARHYGCDLTFESLTRGYAWHAILTRPF